MVSYIDATLGWDFANYEALKGVFTQCIPNWSYPARSYPTRILANSASALVNMTDTPELFGGELRILAAIDFVDRKIVRWVDYWDSSSYDDALYTQVRTPAESFPRDLKDSQVSTQAAPEVVTAATALQQSFRSQDASAAGALLHTDAVFEDMALRTPLSTCRLSAGACNGSGAVSNISESRKRRLAARHLLSQALLLMTGVKEPLIDAQLAALVKCSTDAIVSLSLDGTITSWNRAAERPTTCQPS